MSLFLAPEETLLKSWDFATATPETQSKSNPNDDSILNLTVTSKRIIYQKESSLSLEKREVLMKDVCGVSISRGENPARSNTGTLVTGIILLILGVILTIFGVTLDEMMYVALLLIGLILLIVGIVLICVKNKGSLTFSLNIYTRATSCDLLNVSLKSTPMGNQQKPAPAIVIPLNIFIKKEDIVEIADVIGSLIAKNN